MIPRCFGISEKVLYHPIKGFFHRAGKVSRIREAVIRSLYDAQPLGTGNQGMDFVGIFRRDRVIRIPVDDQGRAENFYSCFGDIYLSHVIEEMAVDSSPVVGQETLLTPVLDLILAE